jgi:hypothetical protein
MRKWGWLGGGVALLLSLAMTAASAAPPRDDDDEGPKASARPPDGWNPLISDLFGLSKPAVKPEKDKDREPEKDRDKKREAAPRAESVASLRALEERKLHRRQDVCLRLREIARETNDSELEAKAIELDLRAWEVYQARTEHLLGGDSGPAPRPAGVREVKP